MLTTAYFAALCALSVFWRGWHLYVSQMSLEQHVRRALYYSYWTLTATMLCGMAASFTIISDNFTHFGIRVLVILVAGIVPQAGIFAFALTPLLMRGRLKKMQFFQCLIITECGIVMPTIFVACLLLSLISRLKP
jgi:hypothetical protein